MDIIVGVVIITEKKKIPEWLVPVIIAVLVIIILILISSIYEMKNSIYEIKTSKYYIRATEHAYYCDGNYGICFSLPKEKDTTTEVMMFYRGKEDNRTYSIKRYFYINETTFFNETIQEIHRIEKRLKERKERYIAYTKYQKNQTLIT